MEADLSAKHIELDKKYRRFRFGLFSGLVLAYGGLGVFLVGLLGLSFFRSSFIYTLSFVGLIIIVAGALILRLTPNVTLEEQLFVRTYNVMSKLNSYVQDTSKRKDKKAAVKRMRKLVDRIVLRWTLDFKLAKTVLGEVADCKQNLKDHVLYTIEQDNLENISYAIQHLSRFARFLILDKPTVEQLAEVNRFLVALPGKPQKPGKLGKMWKWLQGQPTVRTGVILTMTLLSGPVLYAVTTATGTPSSAALDPAVGMSVGFTGIYAAYLGLKRR